MDPLSLQWPGHPQWSASSFSHLYRDPSLTDITLLSHDLAPFKAHRLILSSASPLLASICSLSPRQTDPIIFLRGVTRETLAKVIEFIYLGQVKLPKNQVDAFFKAAQEFQIKGLEKRLNEGEADHISVKTDDVKIMKDAMNVKNALTNADKTISERNAKIILDPVKLEQKMENCSLSGVSDGRQGKVQEKCPLCDKVFHKKCWIKYHIRAAHPDVSAPKEKYNVTNALTSRLKDSTGPYIHRLLNKFEVKKR